MPPIILLGESPTANEFAAGTSFSGSSGVELIKMLDESGIISLTVADKEYIHRYYNTSDVKHIDMIWRLHPEVVRMNVFSAPVANIETYCGPKTEGIPGFPALMKPAKYIRKEFENEIDRLANDINMRNPNLLICLGNTPLWALCGVTGISKLRGTTRLSSHTVADYKILPTYHPAAVLRQWELRAITVMDLVKANREASFPDIRRPQREIWIEPDLADIERFIDEHVRGTKLLSIDIETAGDQITCIGFAPTTSTAIVIPFFDGRKKDRCYWSSEAAERTAWQLVRGVLSDRTIPKLFQNGLYDIAFLWRSMGLKTYGARHDTMLLHHALQPEMLKGLGFLGSVYTDEGSWKSDHRVNKTAYKADA